MRRFPGNRPRLWRSPPSTLAFAPRAAMGAFAFSERRSGPWSRFLARPLADPAARIGA